MCRVKDNILFNKIRDIFRNPKYLEIKNNGCGDVVTDIFWRMVKIAYISDENGELWYDMETPFDVDKLSEVLDEYAKDMESALEILEKFGLVAVDKGVISITVW